MKKKDMTEKDLEKKVDIKTQIEMENAIDEDELLRQFSKEDDTRRLGKKMNMFINVIGFLLAAFLIYTATFGQLPALKQRGVFLATIILLLFLMYPATSKSTRKGVAWYDIILAIVGVIAASYVVFNYEPILLRMGISNTMDQVVFVVLTLLILEGTRRIVSPALAIVSIIFLLYGYFGNYVPGIFKITAGSISRLTDHLFMIPEGIFGTPLGTAATYVTLFVIFSAILQESGMSQLIEEVALGLIGRKTGGPAKVSVFASALFGTISGGAAANVVGTGTFTIPLMMKSGYSPLFSASVEACSSTGGQLIPPVMGAAAFIMAEYIGYPYSKIMLAALVPGFLYYFSIYMAVHLRAKKLGLYGLKKEELPDLKKAMKERGHLFIPFGIVIYLIIRQYTISYAALVGIVLTIIVAQLKKTTRMSFKQVISALTEGSKRGVSFGISTACVGLIIGISTLTGVGITMGDYVLQIAQGSTVLALILIMIMSIIMGMGMPTVAVYIVLATVAAPVIVKMGVPLLAAHLFCFYFGILACVTPPVAVPAYTAAAISGSNPAATGWAALRISLPAFLVPYVFVYKPELLFIEPKLFSFIFTFSVCCLGVVMLAAGWERYLFKKISKIRSYLLIIGGIIVIIPETITTIIGIIIAIVVMGKEYLEDKNLNDGDKGTEVMS